MDQYTAKHRFADVAPRKMRPFAQLIRNQNVDVALEQLRFYPNRGARLIEAVLKSAIANAQYQGVRDLDELIVTEARIDGAPMYKRIRPRARGTAFMIKRRLSHIIISVGPETEVETEPGNVQTQPLAATVTPTESAPALPVAPSLPVPAAKTTPAAPTSTGSETVGERPSSADDASASTITAASPEEPIASRPAESAAVESSAAQAGGSPASSDPETSSDTPKQSPPGGE